MNMAVQTFRLSVNLSSRNQFYLYTSSFNTRYLSGSARATSDAPTAHQRDLTGPPDPVSNLRPVSFHIPPNESKLEREFRHHRQEVQEWNKLFWSEHNTRFNKERDEFMCSVRRGSNFKEKGAFSAEEMSVFYKQFLDKNWALHMNYNAEWYKKNLTLAYLAFKLWIYKLFW